MVEFVKKNKEDIIAIVLLFIISFFFSTTNPFHIWRNGNYVTDQSVFKTISFMMSKGYKPYRDTFDHKGPLLYFIYYFADRFNYENGIWFFDVLVLTFTFFVAYKIVRKFNDIIPSVIIELFSISFLHTCYFDGSLSEVYALPFIIVSLLIFVDYFIFNKINLLRLFVCGASFASILFIRANIISLWIVMTIGVLIKCIRENSMKKIPNYLLGFVLGMLFVSLPIVLWLMKNNILIDFYNVYIKFNIAYTLSQGTSSIEKYKSLIYFGSNVFFVVALLANIILVIKEKKYFNFLHLAYLLFNFYTIVSPGRQFIHYMITMYPCVIYPVIRLVDVFSEKEKKLCCLVLVACISVYPIYDISKISISSFKTKDNNNRSEEINRIVHYIRENTNEDDSISVYGNCDYYYVLSKRIHATRYSFQPVLGRVDSKILDDYYSQLDSELPKVVVVEQQDERIYNFLITHDYELGFEQDTHEGKISVWVRK